MVVFVLFISGIILSLYLLIIGDDRGTLSLRHFLTYCVCNVLFQAQQSNLVQVARSLGRAVPLSPQLIFTPTATVTAVQSESSTQSSSQVGYRKIFSLSGK